jgi:hypothetical protein
MTWSVRIADKNGLFQEEHLTTAPPYNVCGQCKHQSNDWAHPVCYLPLITSGLSTLLTSIDHGSDGHMAPGEAVLKCSGFERKEV